MLRTDCILFPNLEPQACSHLLYYYSLHIHFQSARVTAMSQEHSPEVLTDNSSWLPLKDSLHNIVSDSNSTKTQPTELQSHLLNQTSQFQPNKILSLLGNHLSELPPNFSECLTNLVHLDLSNNQLNDLPNSLNYLQKLSHLNIDSNKFYVIPKIIGELVSLKTLSACNNHIETVPSSLGDLSSLEKLDLSLNKLRDLPTSLSKLHSLKILSLSNNLFRKLPHCVENGMESLSELCLSQNLWVELNIPPRSIELTLFCAEKNGTCPTFPVWLLDSRYKKLETFCLSETNFESFNLPEKEFTSNVRTLKMKQCQLSGSMVEELIGGMVHLEKLLVGNQELHNANGFWYLPINSLKNPENLREIDVSGTEMPSVPRRICNFVGLTALDVGRNNIVWLPKEICSLRNLESLRLDRNRLAALPKDIGKLQKLRELMASHNQICELPESLESLEVLKFFDLYDNEIDVAPMVLRKMTGMVGVDLEQNYFNTENLVFARSGVYENMRASLREHWSDAYRILNGSKLKPPETLPENRRPFCIFSSSLSSLSLSSESIGENSQDNAPLCSTSGDIVNSFKTEHWDTSEDSADEFDPNEEREPKIRKYSPFTIYRPFQRVFCPGDHHVPRVKARIVKMLREGTLVWPSSYAEGQFDDP